MKGPVPTHEEVKDAFDLRRSLLRQQNYQPDAQSPTGSPDPSVTGQGAFRSHVGDDKLPERRLAPYVPEFKRYTQFFSSIDAEKLLMTLALFAEKR